MLEIGSVLGGKYKILSEIGHGGMSVVYMALNEVANKTWAVKEIRKDGKMDFNVVRQGLVAEIETLKRLKHPNLPSIVDVIEDDDSFIIVMDYIEGNSLDRALLEHGAQPQEFVIEWAMQLCDVLRYLHSCDPPIIYRDMKPANIMLKPDGNIALIDFGTAKTYEIDLGETTGIGTIGYAAPEQYIGSGLGRTDARTDIYCLGITLYHLLTGVDPCKNVISDRSIRSVNPALAPGLDKIILKCTEANPEDRYQSCDELLYALEHYTEMTDAYRKVQKKKLGKFILSAVMTLIFASVSILGYASAQNITEKSYEEYIKNASAAKTWQEKSELLMTAIETSPEKKDAYEDLVDLFYSAESDGDENVLTRTESNYFDQIRDGFEKNNSFGIQSSVSPLDKLKENDSDAYIEICESIGFIYWYSYSVENDRHTKAAEWFGKVSDSSQIAKIFNDIGECESDLKTYKSRGNVGQIYTEYKNLWQKIVELNETATGLDDNNFDMKTLVLREIVECIYFEVAELSAVVSSEDLLAVLNSAEKEIESLEKGTSIESLKDTLVALQTQIDETVRRVESAKKYSEEVTEQ